MGDNGEFDLHADGGEFLLADDGAFQVCGDCCDENVRRLTQCNGTATNLYVSVDDAGFNAKIRHGGICYTAGTEMSLPGGGTLLDAVDFTIDANCCVCNYCLNRTPVSAHVSFSGVTTLGIGGCAATVCGAKGGVSQSGTAVWNNLAKPGGYNITQRSGSCGLIDPVAPISTFNWVDACGSDGGLVTTQFAVVTRLQRVNATVWRLTVGNSAGTHMYFWSEYTTTAGDCEESPFIVSNVVSSGPGYSCHPQTGGHIVAWGGSATVTLNF